MRRRTELEKNEEIFLGWIEIDMKESRRRNEDWDMGLFLILFDFLNLFN